MDPEKIQAFLQELAEITRQLNAMKGLEFSFGRRI